MMTNPNPEPAKASLRWRIMMTVATALFAVGFVSFLAHSKKTPKGIRRLMRDTLKGK